METTPITIKARTEQNIEILKLTGILGADNVDQLKQYLNKILKNRTSLAVFDLENLEEIDSSGIGAIINFVKQMRRKNKDVKIYKIQGTVKKIFELLRIDKNIAIINEWEKILSI